MGRSIVDKPLTLGLIVVNVMVFLLLVPEFWSTSQISAETLRQFGLAPVQHPVTGYRFETLVTSVFLHANAPHLLLNLWFLWIFGSKVERDLGKRFLTLLFIISALFSSMVALLAYNYPTLGSQGAISGLAGANLLTSPSAWTFVHILLWLVYNYVMAWLGTAGIGYLSHLAGLTAGVIGTLEYLYRPSLSKQWEWSVPRTQPTQLLSKHEWEALDASGL